MELERHAGNPILSPHADHPWEDLAVFDPAAWLDEATGEVSVALPGGRGRTGVHKCWFGLARSRDGFQFERVGDGPALSPSGEGFDGATIQDPRITRMGDWFYVTYACRHYPFAPVLGAGRTRRLCPPGRGGAGVPTLSPGPMRR